MSAKEANGNVAILGVFVADAAYRAERLPVMGETLLGNRFALGPGGKGSNQAVAVARCGAQASMMTRLGQDDFAQMALNMYETEGITAAIDQVADNYTGSAFIFIEASSGNNAIIICPGAASTIDAAFVRSRQEVIQSADVFITQLEQPVEAAREGLRIAREAGVTTLLNTAPAVDIDDELFALSDYVTPNETEAQAYTGVEIKTPDDARKAADLLLKKGVGTALITLGEQGALLHNAEVSELIPAIDAGAVVETTGAGDAFNGGFAAALAQGADPMSAARFACAVAGISVTRPGTAPSMPYRQEVDALL